MSDLTCQEIEAAANLWKTLCWPLHIDDSPVTVLALALREAEERGRRGAVVRTADVIEEFERRRERAA